MQEVAKGGEPSVASDRLPEVALTLMNRTGRRVPCHAFGARLSGFFNFSCGNGPSSHRIGLPFTEGYWIRARVWAGCSQGRRFLWRIRHSVCV